VINANKYLDDIFKSSDRVKFQKKITSTIIQVAISFCSLILSLILLFISSISNDTVMTTITMTLYFLLLIFTIVLLYLALFKEPLKHYSLNNALYVYFNELKRMLDNQKLSWISRIKISILMFWIRESLTKVLVHIDNQFIFVTNPGHSELINKIIKTIRIIEQSLHKNDNKEDLLKYLDCLIDYSFYTIESKLLLDADSKIDPDYSQLLIEIEIINKYDNTAHSHNRISQLIKSKYLIMFLLLLVTLGLIFFTLTLKNNSYIINTICILGFIYPIADRLIRKK